MKLDFFVPGLPKPGGSKRAFPYRGKDGKTHVAVSDASGRAGKDWRTAIVYAAHAAMRDEPLVTCALALRCVFYLPRPQGHFGKRGLLPRAPFVPITRPDLLKLTRLLEDACSGIIWRDDAQISDELLMKRYAAPPLHPIGVHVRIEPLDPSPRYGTPFLRPLDLSAAVR